MSAAPLESAEPVPASLDVLLIGLNHAPETTGIAPYTTGLARMLADDGHRVHVITGMPHYPQWRVQDGYRGRRARRETDGAVRVTRVPHPVPARPTGASRIGMEAVFAARAAVVRGPRPDVVIAVSPALLSVGAARWVARTWGRGCPVGVVVQDLYGAAVAEAGALGGRGAGAVARLEHGLLAGADGIVAVHDVLRDALLRTGLPAESVTTIRNWTHLEDEPTADVTPTTITAARRALGWPQGEAVVLHAGNIGAKQGLDGVVDAARLADERGLPLRFVLLGDGNQRARLVAAARGVERFTVVDPLPTDAFRTALAAADVLLLHERPEVAEMCAPSKLTSYFAAGRPVLAATNDLSAAAREVRAAGAGPIVPAGDPAALVDAALALVADPDAAARHAASARHYATRTYGAAAAHARYGAWVRDLASRRTTPHTEPVDADVLTLTPQEIS
ncbi:glycosyltransferase family 4 protein [Actinomycetospora chlora]|uniref:Glycosyltransferase family 4 protein n=1 Tax=Actinomycetospora chlora TaxID=663608 RepID=A0ABP9CB81_9PSEU